MNFLLFVVIISIASCVPLVFADNASKVKLVRLDEYEVNEKYLINYYQAVEKINDTHNCLDLFYDVAKDFPMDTEYTVEVSRSSSECANFEKINDYAVTLCTSEKHEYFDYIPDELIPAFTSGKCIVKGHYGKRCHSVFKFYNLLSEEELKDSCFKYVATFKSKDTIFLKKTYIFVSN